MSVKHTEGPWHVEYELDENREKTNVLAICYPKTQCGMTTVADLWNVLASDEENKANADLICAAPEMLEMLKGIQHLCDCQNNSIDGLEELITKAEGN